MEQQKLAADEARKLIVALRDSEDSFRRLSNNLALPELVQDYMVQRRGFFTDPENCTVAMCRLNKSLADWEYENAKRLIRRILRYEFLAYLAQNVHASAAHGFFVKKHVALAELKERFGKIDEFWMWSVKLYYRRTKIKYSRAIGITILSLAVVSLINLLMFI